MSLTRLWSQYRDELSSDPFLILALSAALVTLATTPIAFAILGRLQWFQARRGRVLMRPSFVSIIVGMILVMGIPAIFAAMVLKSRSFDKNRYEFDPNKTWSVLEQGRGFPDLKAADEGIRLEMERLATERKNLVNSVKKLDESMLALRSVAGTSQAVAQRFPSVLQSLAGVRKSVGVDGPQQLLDYTAPPVDLRAIAANAPPVAAPAMAMPATPTATAPVASTAPSSGNGLGAAEVAAELVAVPEPQRTIAAMLPLSELPPGWTVGKSGERYIETFNADNLYEKIDGRAESFLQYGVKGMAYTFYHPTGDASNEIQLYVFEMPDALKALGKYASEKPDEAEPAAIGDQGYTSAGSTLFYAGKYYTQIVSTQDDPKFSAFAMELAKRVVARQKPGSTPPATPVVATTPAPAGTATPPPAETGAKPTPAAAKPAAAEVTPASLFALLPPQKREGEPKYVAQDVFGYSFLSDVFMADYKDGEVSWQGFLRPYRDAKEAKEVFEKYVAGVKKDGAEVKMMSADGADEMVLSNNIGLVDFVFRKGNTLAGANGATSPAAGEAFARALAKSLPANVQGIGQ
ncbi:MAG: DUF6599 family protein [Isosphaeraceae bacterium]